MVFVMIDRYVALLLESPLMTKFTRFDVVEGFFNWTMTYRRDSDIPYPYGAFLQLPQASQKDPR